MIFYFFVENGMVYLFIEKEVTVICFQHKDFKA